MIAIAVVVVQEIDKEKWGMMLFRWRSNTFVRRQTEQFKRVSQTVSDP
jgi:hypothetical protein